nr:uncharacterized protein LOC101256062 [Solanum lycopersicum]
MQRSLNVLAFGSPLSRAARESLGWLSSESNCLAALQNALICVAIGGAVGGAVGVVYGTYDAVRFKVPGLLKIRYIGQTTLGSATIFGLFLGAGSLIH